MSPFAQSSTNILSAGVVIADIIILLLIGVFITLFLKNKTSITTQVARFVSDNILLLGFLVSVGALLGSLFYSNIIGFVPCELCWIQRLFIYPQVILFGVGMYHAKKGMSTAGILLSSFIMSIIGAAVAAFHSYGQLYNPGILAACEVNGVSCSKLYFVSYGYVTIPTMSLTVFLLLIILLLIKNKYSKTA